MENPFLDTVWQSGTFVLNWNSILSPKLHFVCCTWTRLNLPKTGYSNAFQTGTLLRKEAWHLTEGLSQENCQKNNLVLSTLIVLPSSLPPPINLVYQQRSVLKNHEIGWKWRNGKKKSSSLQNWMSLCGQSKVISADWQDLEEPCPIWNIRSLPGYRKFDESSHRVEIACLKTIMIIIINHNSLIIIIILILLLVFRNKVSGKSFMSPVLSSSSRLLKILNQEYRVCYLYVVRVQWCVD